MADDKKVSQETAITAAGTRALATPAFMLVIDPNEAIPTNKNKKITLDDVSQHVRKFTVPAGLVWDGSNKQIVLDSDKAITFSPGTNQWGVLTLTQDATGGRTATIDGNSVAVNTAANSTTMVTAVYVDPPLDKFFFLVANPGLSISGGGGGDTTPPSRVSIRVENATPTKVRILYDEPLDTASIPANTDYILNEASPGSGFTGTPVVGSNYVELTLSTPMAFGDVWDLGYVGTAVRDLASNSAAGFSTIAITNAVTGGGGGAVAIDFDHVDANLVAAGTDGYKKINTSAWDAFATASSVFTVGETLTCKLTPPTTGSQLFFGLTDTLTPTVSGDFKYGLFFDATPNVSKWNLGTPVILTTWTVPDMYQIRWVSGTTLEYYKSTDGGTTWTFIGNQTAFDPTCNIIFIAINTINAQFENLTRE